MGDWDVVSTAPARSAGGPAGGGAPAAGEWDVVSTAPSRGRRGPRSPNGPPTPPTRGQGATPDNPIPYGGRAQRGQYIVAGDGTTMLRGNDGVFRRVELPGVNSGGGFNGMTRRDRQRRQAENSNARPPARPRADNPLAQIGDDLAEPFRNAGAAWNAWSASDNKPLTGNPLADMGDQVMTNMRWGGAALASVTAPIAAPINAVTRPIARWMTDAGIGNDDKNNEDLNLLTALLIPERGGPVTATPSTMRRFAPVTGERPTMANALADPRNAPPPLPQNAFLPPAPPTRPPSNAAVRRGQVNALRVEGVEPTIGQRMGPAAASIEDKAMSVPILGDAIRGARLRGREQLNRAVANRALAPIGEELPRNVRPGNDAVAYVQERIGNIYDQAAGLITDARIDQEFGADLASIRANNVDLPANLRDQFEAILQARVLSRLEGQSVTGAQLKDIQAQIGKLAADYRASTDGGARTFGDQLAALSDALKSLGGRSSPEAAALFARADEAWSNFDRLRRASSGTATAGGVFTPQQLKGAVRAGDRSVAKGATARGDARMYDLADNATSVMNGTIPDSGTAGRALFATLAGGAAIVNPVALKAVAVATGLAIPYLLTARRIGAVAMKARGSAAGAEAMATLERMATETPSLRGFVDQVKAASAPAIVASEGGQNAQ